MHLLTILRCLPVLLAAACTAMPRGIEIPGAGRYPLLPAAVFAQSKSVTHSVAVSGRHSLRFLLQTEAGPAGIAMVGLTDFGQKLFELEYKGDILTVKTTPFLPASLVPEKLFADFQLIYWPCELLRGLFAGTGVEILETTGEPGQQRRFLQGDSAIIEITYSPSRAIENNLAFRNFRQSYDMRIEVLSTLNH